MSGPGATYRVQLHAGFGFSAVADLADYLAALGVTHVYCSPILQAAPGSTHGYDVVDPTRISAELGGEEGFRRMAAALRARDIGVVVDIVPNHMATAGRSNAWWWDVLEDGPSSRYARFFDIDWDPPEAKLRQRVLVPILGDHYGRVLERGELRLVRAGADFSIRYFDHELPVSPRTLDEVLAEAAGFGHGESAPTLVELARGFAGLPHAAATERELSERRHRDKARLRERLADVLGLAGLAEALDRSVGTYNGDPDRLDGLLQRQNYRLARWQVAGEELDYRRFFDISGLVGLRVEDQSVFDATHGLLASLVAEGLIDGMRVDHPDGLRDPAAYLQRLAAVTDGTWVVVEKILEGSEALPAGWAAAGTTGYDFANCAGGLLVDPRGELELTELYRRIAGDDSYTDLVRQAKDEVMSTSLATDVERATAVLVEVCEGSRRYRDFTRSELRAALREVIASLEVYRTYVSPGRRAGPADRERLESVLERSAAGRPDLDPELFALLGSILLGEDRSPVAAEMVQRFQQVTGPVMAKGVEDTVFYRYLRLTALNEVGGDPSRWGRSVDEFHDHNRLIADSWPDTMVSTSTHDTKRSEDVRARLAVVSEVPGLWTAVVPRWSECLATHRRDGFADPVTEYLLLQSMIGAAPISLDRLQAYMLKAVREARRSTSWASPDGEYESALAQLIEGAYGDPQVDELLGSVLDRIVPAGRVNSLALAVLRLSSPGVPDTYQGTETWDLSLVDPDNRRPVDHEGLARGLSALGPTDEARRGTDSPVPPVDETGAAKLFLTSRLLRLRRSCIELRAGMYRPHWATGPRSDHVVAFDRGEQVLIVVPRLTLSLEEAGGWAGTTLGLPPGPWRDVFTGRIRHGSEEMEALLSEFPVSVLVRQ